MEIAKIESLHRKYAPNDEDFKAVFEHCRIVADIAEWCAQNVKEKVDIDLLKTAALLHDIGSYPFLAAWEVRDNYRKYYAQHAILGAKILEYEGLDRSIWQIVETHELMGLTKQEIIDADISLPARNYEPQTIEGRLLCYADRFHSKKPIFNSFDTFHDGLVANFPLQAAKFKEWSKEFGIPDLDHFSQKYNHPIR